MLPRMIKHGVCAAVWCGAWMSLPHAAVGQAREDPGPWLGVAPPSGLALPPQLSVLKDPAFSADPATVPPGEEGYTELEGPRVHQWLERIVGFSRESHDAGDRVWGRVSGFPAAHATAEWVAQQYREAGLTGVEVQRYDADAPMWWADDWEVRLLADPAFGADAQDVVLGSAVPTSGAELEEGTITAPVVFVGEADDPSAVDVAGKVAVQRRRPASGAFAERSVITAGAQKLFDRGAVAVLNYVDQPGNMHVRDFRRCGLCFNIGGEDGAFVRSIAERAAGEGVSDRLRARIRLRAGMRSGLSAQNAIGIVQGESDEIVVVNAHLDGWYDAAGDNGDGLAVQVALAHHFAQPEHKPARTLVFMASGGHHSPGLGGPANFLKTNPDLASRIVLVLNLEHVAQYEVDPQSWQVRPAEQPMGWGVDNMAPFLLSLTDRGVERYAFRLRPDYGASVPGDLGRYAPLGVPRVQAIHAGPLYHTSGDVLESVSVEGLERAARFYAFFINGVANAQRSQIDP